MWMTFTRFWIIIYDKRVQFMLLKASNDEHQNVLCWLILLYEKVWPLTVIYQIINNMMDANGEP